MDRKIKDKGSMYAVYVYSAMRARAADANPGARWWKEVTAQEATQPEKAS